MSTADPNEVQFPAIALGAAMASSFLVGGIAGAFGPLLPLMQERFTITLPTAGTAVSVFYAAAITGSLAILFGARLVRGVVLLWGSFAALGLGALGIATASVWPALVASVFVFGVGFGGLDTGLNQFMARTGRRYRAALVNLLNAMYPIGAIFAPIIVTTLGLMGFSLGYVGLSVASLLGALAVSRMVAPRTRRKPTAMPFPSAGPRRSRPTGRAFVSLLVLSYVLEVGVEVGVTSWLASQLIVSGHTESFASLITAGYWAALALARIAIAPLAHSLPYAPVILTCCLIASVAIGLVAIPACAPVAFIVTGLALGPIFPTGLVWLAEERPGHTDGLSFLLVASMTGGAIAPAIVSAGVAVYGMVSMSYVLLGLALAMSASFAVVAVIGRRGRRNLEYLS